MNHKEFKKRLIEYMAIYAMSRYEEPVAEALKNNTKSNNFEYLRDGLGSLIIYKKSQVKNPLRVMIAAHMDEVGYLVRNIDKSGQLLLSPVGGIWPTVVVGTKARLVTNKDNKIFNGVFGHTSIHIMKSEDVSKAITNDKIYADFGFLSKNEAKQKGVEIGDRVYLTGEIIQFDNTDLIGGKAMDNRAGITVLDYVANQIKNLDLDFDLYLVGTVQEEVGARGAKACVNLINPHIAIALDTTSSHDTIGTILGETALFKGAALRIKDGGTLMDPKLVEFIYNIAKSKNIKTYKFIAAGGGTDAAELQYGNHGAATLTLSLPQRYLHSPIGVCAISDLITTGDLLIEFLKAFNTKEYDKIKY